MSGSVFLSQARVTWAAKQRGTKIKVNIIVRINRKECEIRWLAQGNLTTVFEEHFVRGALRFRSGPLDLEVQLWVLRVDSN